MIETQIENEAAVETVTSTATVAALELLIEENEHAEEPAAAEHDLSIEVSEASGIFEVVEIVEAVEVAETEEAATENDPAILKLLEYAKPRKTLSMEELNDFLPEHILNSSDKIEPVFKLLESNGIQIVEEDTIDDHTESTSDDFSKDDFGKDDFSKSAEAKQAEHRRKDMLDDKKASLVDDPVRLYLREIGREKLLTAEQEIELSRQMEEARTSSKVS
jgi:hypothetical protein